MPVLLLLIQSTTEAKGVENQGRKRMFYRRCAKRSTLRIKILSDIAGRVHALEGTTDNEGDDDAFEDSSGTAGTINALLDADTLSDFLTDQV